MTFAALANPGILTQPVYEPGKIAAWVAPPRNGINGQPFDYDYVHLA